jgi:hypothetical protein
MGLTNKLNPHRPPDGISEIHATRPPPHWKREMVLTNRTIIRQNSHKKVIELSREKLKPPVTILKLLTAKSMAVL